MVIEWLNEISQNSPSLLFAWSSLLATSGATVALSIAFGYLLWYWPHTRPMEIIGTASALFSSAAYAIYYALLINGSIQAQLSAVVLRPVNTFLFCSLILLAGLVVNNNKVTRQLTQINAMLAHAIKTG